MTIQGAYTNDNANRVLVYLDVYPESTNIAANTTTFRYRAWRQDGNPNRTGEAQCTYAWYFRGGLVASGGGYYYANDYQEFINTTFTVGHNPDGSLGPVSANGGLYGNSAGGTGIGVAEISFNVEGVTDFNFSAGTPPSLTATFIAGTGTKLDWGASVSFKSPVTYYTSWRSSTNGGASYGAWSAETSTTALTYTYTGLTPGLTYQFRVRAYNGFDNYSGFRESNTVFLTAGGKRFLTPNWILTAAQAKRWTGSAWQTLTTAKRYDEATKSWVSLS